MLGHWLKEDENEDGQAFRGNGKLTPDQEEIRKLKAQVKRLEMEREILKKATVDSTCQRNTIFNYLLWCFKAQTLPRPIVQLSCYFIK